VVGGEQLARSCSLMGAINLLLLFCGFCSRLFFVMRNGLVVGVTYLFWFALIAS
jgi:hypothetical protein